MHGATPTFTNPPIIELVLGVEFTPIDALKSIHYQGIYDLFRDDFPNSQDEQPLVASHDRGEGDPQTRISFQVDAKPPLPRLWFLSPEKDLLIQFQADRFVLNWRKQNQQDVYPSFEALAPKFEHTFNKLTDHIQDKFGIDLNVEQIEVSYVNMVSSGDFPKLYKFQKIIDDKDINLEGLGATFGEVLSFDEYAQSARLIYDIQVALEQADSSRDYRLCLTVRGSPKSQSNQKIKIFMQAAHDKIVGRFLAITTRSAQQKWGKT